LQNCLKSCFEMLRWFNQQMGKDKLQLPNFKRTKIMLCYEKTLNVFETYKNYNLNGFDLNLLKSSCEKFKKIVNKAEFWFAKYEKLQSLLCKCMGEVKKQANVIVKILSEHQSKEKIEVLNDDESMPELEIENENSGFFLLKQELLNDTN